MGRCDVVSKCGFLVWSSLILFLGSPLSAGSKKFDPPIPMVAVRIADVRTEPVASSGTYAHDPLQETQLDIGEPVLVYEKKGGWVRVEAPEQIEFSHHQRWEGYPGWVEEKALTKDLTRHHRLTKLSLPENELRKKILEAAVRHLGNPYLWGGRSLYDSSNRSVATGVDCSGLVNWSFRQVGWFIPRDALEQFMRARRLEGSQVRPADLIFLADPASPEKVTHVAFVDENGNILEAPQTGDKVRRMSFVERFGKPMNDLKSGDRVGDNVIYFGSYFVEE